MEQKPVKKVLFLCTGNYYRSRFAEIYFNFLAGKIGLFWRAYSRALAIEMGTGNLGPLSRTALSRIESLGISDPEAQSRFPRPLLEEDLTQADRIVALKREEHEPMLHAKFPAWMDKVEYWQVNDDPGALDVIEELVPEFVAGLLGEPTTIKRPERQVTPPTATKKIQKAKPVLKLHCETKGRRGKGVTIVSGPSLSEIELPELATHLKQRCGTGGTVKDGRIEIQGDQRDRLEHELSQLGYTVKRA